MIYHESDTEYIVVKMDTFHKVYHNFSEEKSINIYISILTAVHGAETET